MVLKWEEILHIPLFGSAVTHRSSGFYSYTLGDCLEMPNCPADTGEEIA